ncbi:hypothetical protein [Pseudobdellovibrio exovorus]|uniref:Uncharacterized protein n=1 Tax=Pseudobdellovibrio exovorus JSS TaxID=1184267 RepID=M4V9Y9_9BACT|nr:hypothetical protein [Pseudobdellovibrio exovorus]AGH94846.1 hypothetical protein A11Q_626 [Pseudobdellovibrio exovorus JSS]
MSIKIKWRHGLTFLLVLGLAKNLSAATSTSPNYLNRGASGTPLFDRLIDEYDRESSSYREQAAIRLQVILLQEKLDARQVRLSLALLSSLEPFMTQSNFVDLKRKLGQLQLPIQLPIQLPAIKSVAINKSRGPSSVLEKSSSPRKSEPVIKEIHRLRKLE